MEGKASSLKWTIIGLLCLALYQGMEVASKLRTLRILHPVKNPEAVSYSYIGDDYPKELPLRVDQVAMNAEWLDDEVYGPYADEDWASNFPKSNGWVALGPNHDMFVLSMFHQLHCLDALRFGYVTAKARVLEFPGNGTGVEHHVNHCLTYLREMILCAGDMTLETSVPTINSIGQPDNAATGLDILHKCRDWTQIRDYLDEDYEERQKWKAEGGNSTSESMYP